jgi:hypothetical protein
MQNALVKNQKKISKCLMVLLVAAIVNVMQNAHAKLEIKKEECCTD